MKTRASNGLEAADLGGTAYKVWHACLERQAKPWDQIVAIDQEPWQEAAALAINIIDLPGDEQASLEISAKELGRNLYAQYMAARGMEPKVITTPEELAWEAVGRHLANLIDSDGSADVPQCEARVVEWVRNKRQLVC